MSLKVSGMHHKLVHMYNDWPFSRWPRIQWKVISAPHRCGGAASHWNSPRPGKEKAVTTWYRVICNCQARQDRSKVVMSCDSSISTGHRVSCTDLYWTLCLSIFWFSSRKSWMTLRFSWCTSVACWTLSPLSGLVPAWSITVSVSPQVLGGYPESWFTPGSAVPFLCTGGFISALGAFWIVNECCFCRSRRIGLTSLVGVSAYTIFLFSYFLFPCSSSGTSSPFFALMVL